MQNLILCLVSTLNIKIQYYFCLTSIRSTFYPTYCIFRGVNHSRKYKYKIFPIFWWFQIFEITFWFLTLVLIFSNFLFKIAHAFRVFLCVYDFLRECFKRLICHYFWADNKQNSWLIFEGYWHTSKVVDSEQEEKK